MSSEQDPNDPLYYAPLRERSKSPPLSISHPPSLDIQLRKAVALRKQLEPEVIYEPAGLARELRRAALFSVAARFGAVVAVVAVVALLFVLMLPASRQSDASSTSSEITGSIRTALPQSSQGDDGSKPALAAFQGVLASAPVNQPATNEQSQQLLQQFLQWRQKANSTKASQ
jgi:hypothetical protein